MSKANPQFNKDTLPGVLAGFDISYEHMGALGGLRGKHLKLARLTPGAVIQRGGTVVYPAAHRSDA
jgi:hypothetical protein